LMVDFDAFSRFLNLEFAPTNLTSLHVDSAIFETVSSIHGLLSMVADTCQMLKSFALVSSSSGITHAAQVDDAEQYAITFNHLKPILKMANLKSLEIFHHHPLALTEEDIEILAASWPSLENLILNDEPVLLKESNLTVAALLPFARHCPDLMRLGLFIDTSSVELSTFTTSPFVPFKRLKCLSMGVSVINDGNPVALYLSHILPLGCTVDSGISWQGQSLSRDVATYQLILSRRERWAQVDRLLPLLIGLRIDEKERLRVMEREIDDLRMRNEILEEHTRSGPSIESNTTTCIVI